MKRGTPKLPSIWKMALQSVWNGGPGLCHFAITSACNARCGFCSFARDQLPAASRHSVTLSEAKRASDILKRNGVRFLHFTGGEPLVHRDFTAMVAHASQIGMVPTLVTNGALMTPKRVALLADAGLATVYISIDAASRTVHDANRGLPGLSARIRRANAALKRRQIPSSASVTMSRLVDYPALPAFLQDLGFGAVTFSYPLRTLPSSYLACAESPLVDFAPEELHTAFEAVKTLSREFPVLNPVASIEDMQRHLHGEPEIFGCLAGWKSFYLDWHLQLWRCHNWDRPLCDIRDFDGTQRVRDGCTACMIDCYRDDSVMQHVGVAMSDGVRAAAHGDFRQAWHHWTDGRNVVSAREAIRTARAWTGGGDKRLKQPIRPTPEREAPDARSG
ncbi:MAG: radical SAM protein [Alphaproteobacteria bacterium]|nr:radical SAM protein [Alphaproteobacteria bacterium]